MTNPLAKSPHILFLFSDTGGGHRSAAEAIIEALGFEFDGRITSAKVDIFKDYAPRPLNRMPDIYPHIVRVPRAWGLGYHLSDGHRRARLITASAWPYMRRKIRALVSQNPCDLIVSVHPLANAPALHAIRTFREKRLPFVTVVTDLVTTHALWYHRRADLCLVPTQMAYQRALECGLQPDQVQVTGLPVADRFCKPAGDPQEVRLRLGWPVERPVILLVGGGEGMGPLEKTARVISAAGLPATLVIVAGRNKELKAKLESLRWPVHTFIYGFVQDMPDFMQAADILVTKAGPGTICEAFNAGLPMVLSSRLPGQEDGNVAYVTSRGAGIWAPRAEHILSALQDWIENPEKRQRAAAACQRLARPEAARRIARILATQMGVE
jgi:1,2-diacylglycerol 3-beta-galactosyltransferase